MNSCTQSTIRTNEQYSLFFDSTLLWCQADSWFAWVGLQVDALCNLTNCTTMTSTNELISLGVEARLFIATVKEGIYSIGQSVIW